MLRDEYGFDGGNAIVKVYIRAYRRRTREMFVQSAHTQDKAQRDFGETLAVIVGMESKRHCFVLDVPHSDGCFFNAYPAETIEAFEGGVAQSILYDYSKQAVVKILDDGRGQRSRAFIEL